MKKTPFRFFRKRWVIVTIIILVVVGGYLYVRAKPAPPNFQYTVATVGNVSEQVSVTGAVSPVGKADLAFEKGGVVSKIYVKVGDHVMVGEPIASLDNANDEAALASVEATLADMTRSLTPQELAVQETSVQNAESDVQNATHDGYVKAQGALFNYTDSFFTNPQTVNPTINIRTQSSLQQTNINNERVAVTDTLTQWSSELAGANTSNAEKLAEDSLTYLQTIKMFMNDLSVIISSLNVSNSGVAQSVIDAATARMNSGLSALNDSINSVTAAKTELDTAQSNYNLKLSGNSSESIASQKAKVAQAKALLAQDTITSPLDGIVTKVDPNVGEYVAPGSTGFAVQDTGFKIEAFVPEADIAKISVGDMASSTLDAYGAYVNFPAQVTMIDPAETVLEGVPTYKVTLHFTNPDSRILSGMTANLEVGTHEVDNVLEIPFRALTVTATSTSVRLVSSDGKSYTSVPVTVGLKGSDGTVEVTSGLNPGDKVVTYVKS